MVVTCYTKYICLASILQVYNTKQFLKKLKTSIINVAILNKLYMLTMDVVV